MKEVGSKRDVLRKKACKTKKGETYASLTAENPKYAALAKRSESAQNSAWRKHVSDYAKKKKVTYAAALSDPECKKGYKKPSLITTK